MPDINKLSALERIALRLSFEAPIRQHKWASGAKVDWETIHELRRELERLGFDWKAGAKVTQRIELEARKEAYAARTRLQHK